MALKSIEDIEEKDAVDVGVKRTLSKGKLLFIALTIGSAILVSQYVKTHPLVKTSTQAKPTPTVQATQMNQEVLGAASGNVEKTEKVDVATAKVPTPTTGDQPRDPTPTQTLIAQAQQTAGSVASEVGKTADSVKQGGIQQVEKTISNVASQSAGMVTDFVFKNTIGIVISQFDKLPEKQKEEAKKIICK